MPSIARERVALTLPAYPDAREAIGYLGYGGQGVDDALVERLDQAYAACGEFRPRGVFGAFDVLGASGDPDVLDVTKADRPLVGEALLVGPRHRIPLSGESITLHLRGAVRAVVMVVTLGMESERAVRRESALSPTDGLLLDAMASSMTEHAAGILEKLVSKWAGEQGFRAGSRFSPGYGDLSLNVQQALLDAVDAGRLLGVSTTSENMLVPSKSITAIVGLFDRGGSRDHLDGEPYSCTRAHSSARTEDGSCETCDMSGRCVLHAQGRNCHGS